jgi:DNA-binding transcriptional MocR family regulator
MTTTADIQSTDRTIGSSRLARLIRDVSGIGAADGERRPAYRALSHSVRALILDGRISLHTRVPAERDLASALGMSRTTVTAAYDLLRQDGFLESRRGSGTWTTLPEGTAPASLGGWILPSDSSDLTSGVAIDLSCAAFPMSSDLMAEVLAETAPRLAACAAGPGYHHSGLPELRIAVADQYTARGLPTSPEQIVITSGALHGLVLAMWLLCGPGDRVLVENPTYPNSLEAIRRSRLRPVPVPVGEYGIETEALDSQLRQAVPRLAYLIPDFQNPTGSLMPEAQRAVVAEAARCTGTWIVADETISEMALDVPAPRPFAACAPRGTADQIITVGSMSKTHWGGLRIGWIRTTARMAVELAGQRVAMDMAGSVIDQVIAVALLRRQDEVIAERHRVLRERRAALETALARELPEWSWRTPTGGLSLWVDIGEPSAAALAARAAARGVRIEGGSRFGVDPGTFEQRIRIPYTLPVETLDEAVRRLAAAFRCEDAPVAVAEESRWVA